LLEQVLATKLRVHGEHSQDVAIAHQNVASTLIDAGRAAPALDHLERALAILTKTAGADHPIVANVHSTLAGAHARLDHPAEALAHAQRALAIREQAEVGAGHIAYSRYELAQILVATGKRTEGIALAKRALELPLAATGREGALAAALREFIEQHQRR
jgi:tetratricopeptide (TPR) repeat protein